MTAQRSPAVPAPLTHALPRQRDFGTNVAAIPPHGRWRHFDAAGLPRITTLLAKFHADKASPLEAARRLVDLFVVSVLLDAGAGPKWTYEERKTGLKIGRSEGLAVASLDMFESGLFARAEDEGGDGAREKCEAQALARLTPELLSISLQVDPATNPMDGLEGRAGLVSRLGEVVGKDAGGFFKGPTKDTDGSAKRPGFLVGEYACVCAQLAARFLTLSVQTTFRTTQQRRETKAARCWFRFPLSGRRSSKALHPYGPVRAASFSMDR